MSRCTLASLSAGSLSSPSLLDSDSVNPVSLSTEVEVAKSLSLGSEGKSSGSEGPSGTEAGGTGAALFHVRGASLISEPGLNPSSSVSVTT